MTWRDPNHPDLPHWVRRGGALLHGGLTGRERGNLGNSLAFHHLVRGELAKATIHLELAQIPHRESARQLSVAMESLCSWLAGGGDGDSAASEAPAGDVHDSEQTGDDLGVLMASACRTLSSAGHDEMGPLLGSVEEVVAARGRRIDYLAYYLLSSWAALRKEDFLWVEELADVAMEISAEIGAWLPEALARWLKAQALFEQGERKAAREQLRRVTATANTTHCGILEYMCHYAAAQFALASGKEATTLRSLRKAFGLGRGRGYTYFVGFRRRVMAELCVRALEADIETGHVQQLIQRCGLEAERPPLQVDRWPWVVRIYTLGTFAVHHDGEPVRFTGKAQRKPLDLLRALVALGGRDVAETTLSDALWPDADGDAAHSAFTTTLSRLRKLLGHSRAIRCRDGRVSIDPQLCWVDIWAFEDGLAQIRELERGDGTGRLGAIWRIEKSLALYRGTFLRGEGEEFWMISTAERLRTLYLRAVRELGRYWEQTCRWERALLCYEEGLAVDDLIELFYQRQMACYGRLGRYAEGLAVYHRCRKILAVAFGVEPSPETEEQLRLISGGGNRAPVDGGGERAPRRRAKLQREPFDPDR